jgi:hypothetical protein
MDLELFAKETQLAYKRYLDNQHRLSLREGGGVTDDARAISTAYIDRVVEAVPSPAQGVPEAT